MLIDLLPVLIAVVAFCVVIAVVFALRRRGVLARVRVPGASVQWRDVPRADAATLGVTVDRSSVVGTEVTATEQTRMRIEDSRVKGSTFTFRAGDSSADGGSAAGT